MILGDYVKVISEIYKYNVETLRWNKIITDFGGRNPLGISDISDILVKRKNDILFYNDTLYTVDNKVRLIKKEDYIFHKSKLVLYDQIETKTRKKIMTTWFNKILTNDDLSIYFNFIYETMFSLNNSNVLIIKSQSKFLFSLISEIFNRKINSVEIIKTERKSGRRSRGCRTLKTITKKVAEHNQGLLICTYFNEKNDVPLLIEHKIKEKLPMFIYNNKDDSDETTSYLKPYGNVVGFTTDYFPNLPMSMDDIVSTIYSRMINYKIYL